MDLAKASLSRVEKRDPYKLFHKMDRMGLMGLTPDFDWGGYLKVVGLDQLDSFNVTEPEFYKELDRQLQTRSLGDLKTYLRLHLASGASPSSPRSSTRTSTSTARPCAASSSCGRAGSAA